MHAIEVGHLWKKFRMNRTHPRGGSLRDTIPRTLCSLFGRNGTPEGTFWALKDVSFDAAPGEALGIIGPNGAGKSTILKILSGILRPDLGAIRVSGRLAALIELGAGFHPDLTGRENVYLNGAILGLKKREIDRKFDEIVEFAGIEEFIDTPVKRYSSGMAIRLGFAIAAHTDPDILLIDEVLAVGDLAFQHRCFARIRQLRAKGIPILFVSHNLYAVEAICDRVLLLANGEKVLEGEPATVLDTYERTLFDSLGGIRNDRAPMALGLKVIEILRVMTLGHADTPQQEFETGEPMTVRIDFRASEQVINPVFGVAIHNAAGLYCYGTNTRLDNLHLGPVNGRGCIEITYDALSLLRDYYQITVGVFESTAEVAYDFQDKVCTFRIKTLRNDRGALYLKHRWHLLHMRK